MLTIVLVYFVGKYFYTLAETYKQNKWLFAILGVVCYYFGASVIGGVVLGLADEFLGIRVNWDNTLMLSFMLMPFGFLLTYGFYYILKKKWEKSVVPERDEIQDIGKTRDDLLE